MKPVLRIDPVLLGLALFAGLLTALAFVPYEATAPHERAAEQLQGY